VSSTASSPSARSLPDGSAATPGPTSRPSPRTRSWRNGWTQSVSSARTRRRSASRSVAPTGTTPWRPGGCSGRECRSCRWAFGGKWRYPVPHRRRRRPLGRPRRGLGGGACLPGRGVAAPGVRAAAAHAHTGRPRLRRCLGARYGVEVWALYKESGTKCGSSRCHVLSFRRRHEGWVPAAEVSGKVVIQHPGADLEQEVGPSLRPEQLLLDQATNPDTAGIAGVSSMVVVARPAPPAYRRSFPPRRSSSTPDSTIPDWGVTVQIVGAIA